MPADDFAIGGRLIAAGEWAGWRTRGKVDPFEDLCGPFYFREENGAVVSAFRADARHLNGAGFLHGGMLMAFADFSLFAIGWRKLQGFDAVTVSLNGDFLAPIRPEVIVTSTGDIVKDGRSLLFVRGVLDATGSAAVSFSGIIKKIRRT
jgi:uncharacterized protein (TIGR00369 family)